MTDEKDYSVGHLAASIAFNRKVIMTKRDKTTLALVIAAWLALCLACADIPSDPDAAENAAHNAAQEKIDRKHKEDE